MKFIYWKLFLKTFLYISTVFHNIIIVLFSFYTHAFFWNWLSEVRHSHGDSHTHGKQKYPKVQVVEIVHKNPDELRTFFSLYKRKMKLLYINVIIYKEL